MKKKMLYMLSALLLLIAPRVQAQDTVYLSSFTQDPEDVLITPPCFPARFTEVQGFVPTSIDDYLAHFVQYPAEAMKHFPIGTEVIEFEVTPEGKLQSFNVINSVSPEIDQEVIRVLKTTEGNWTTGIRDRKPTTMIREVRLIFKPHSSYDLVSHAKTLHQTGNKMMFLKKDPKRALHFYNQAIRMLPNEECILCSRCLCRYELGDEEGALADLGRIMEINPLVRDQFAMITLEDYFAQLKHDSELTFLAQYKP